MNDTEGSTKKPILVDTEAAAVWVGRSVWTVYRWASQGRLTRHGGGGRGNARWDLRELTEWKPDSGRPMPPPPPVKISSKLSG